MRKKYLCILICLFANALAFASAANRTITGVVISGTRINTVFKRCIHCRSRVNPRNPCLNNISFDIAFFLLYSATLSAIGCSFDTFFI